MMTIAMLLGVAALGLGLARRLGIPAAPLVIALGIATRVSGVPLDESFVRDALVLATTFLLFLAGTEFDLQHVQAQRWVALRIGTARMIILAAVGLTVGRLMGFSWLPSLYLTLALTASSTLLVTETLRQREQYFEPLGRLVLGVLLLQSLFVIVAASVVGIVAQGAAPALIGTLGLFSLLILSWACARWLAPRIVVRTNLDGEEQLLVLLGMLFVFMGIAHGTGLSYVAGAFFAGLALSRFPVSGLVRGHMASFSDFFIAVFYVCLGATVALPGARELLVEGTFVAAVMLLVSPMLIVIVRRAGLTLRSSIEGMSLLAQSGELCLVIGLLGLERGHLHEGAFSVIVMVAVVTMSLAPLLASDRVIWRLVRWYPFSRHRDLPAPPRDHVLIIGGGSSTRALIEWLHEQPCELLVVDDDPAVIDQLSGRGIRAIRGDGGSEALLRAAGADTARVVLSTMRRVADNERLLRLAGHAPALVRVFSSAEAERIRALGGSPVTEAELALEAFLAWYDGEHGPGGARAD